MARGKSRLKSGNRRFSAVALVEITVSLGGIGLFLLPPPANWIEMHYSRGIYPHMQRIITAASNVLPVALFDVLMLFLIVAPVWWWIRLKRAGRGHRFKEVLALAFHTLCAGALAILIFQMVWGLNYSRLPLTAKLDYDQSRVTPASIEDLRRTCITELNSTCGEAHSIPWPVSSKWQELLKPSFESVVKELGTDGGTTPGRIKHSLFNFYLAASGIDGFINPYGLESILNDRLIAVEQPFAIAHEWGHLAGFADESEANFIALLTCLGSGNIQIRYAGWLALLPNLPEAQSDQKPAEPELQLDPRVMADLSEIAQHWRADLRPWVNAAQWRFYDRFLKANHVEAGVASYGLFVRLVAGTKFSGNWVPEQAEIGSMRGAH